MAKQSKKDAEKVKQEEHKARLADAKARRRQEPVLERGKPILKEKPTILIYCEGQNTEPSYFSKFKISSASILAYGEGRNTVSLVEQAWKIVGQYKKKGKSFQQVWCVFDADPKGDNPQQIINFNEAIALSKKYGFKTAYSNQAFEYWLLLHFEDHQGGAMPRADYDSKLNHYLKPYGLTYDGKSSKIVTPGIFEVLTENTGMDKRGKPKTRTHLAVNRAEKIYNKHGEKDNHSNPGSEESSTTVFKLVEELQKWS
jgi:hypothetical protein